MLKKLKNIALESIFPSSCVVCDKLGSLVCDPCYAQILKITKPSCVFCGKASLIGRLCPTCRPKYHLSGVLCFGYFKDERLKEIIHVYKYEDVFALKSTLASYLRDVFSTKGVDVELITFVPISKKRLAKRGYNQSELLSKELGILLGIETKSILKKTKETKTQVGLKRKERRQNLNGAFKLIKNIDIKNKKVLIIDDVVTTGATLDECAKTLKGEGAREVWGLTLAKE